MPPAPGITADAGGQTTGRSVERPYASGLAFPMLHLARGDPGEAEVTPGVESYHLGFLRAGPVAVFAGDFEPFQPMLPAARHNVRDRDFDRSGAGPVGAPPLRAV